MKRMKINNGMLRITVPVDTTSTVPNQLPGTPSASNGRTRRLDQPLPDNWDFEPSSPITPTPATTVNQTSSGSCLTWEPITNSTTQICFRYVGAYLLALHASSSPFQLFVVQDFIFDNITAELLKNYGTVSVIKVSYSDCCRLVSSCSMCPETDRFQLFYRSDFSSTPAPEFSRSVIAGCRHCENVIAHLLFSLLEAPPKEVMCLKEVEATILSEMDQVETLDEGRPLLFNN